MSNQRWIKVLICLLAMGALMFLLTMLPMLDEQGGKAETDVRQHPAPRWVGEPIPTLADRTRASETTSGDHANTERRKIALDGGWVRISGSLRSEDGSPIARGLVYLLAKSARGAYSTSDLPTAGTDAEGRFTLRATDLGDSWLAGIAEGHFPTFVDADTIPPGESVDLTLRTGGLVEVLTRESRPGQSNLTTFVDISSAKGEGRWRLPGPTCEPEVSMFRPVPEGGRIVLRVGTRGAIKVKAVRHGHFCTPEYVTLESPDGRAEFTLSPSCGLRVRVIDAGLRVPLAQQVRMEVIDPQSGSLINGALFTSAQGEFELADRLRPGKYRVRVLARGYETWMRENVELAEPGRRTELLVQLARDTTLARFRLQFSDLAERVRSGRLAAAPRPLVMCHWANSKPHARRWRETLDFAWDASQAVAEMLLPHDRVGSLIVWEPSSGRVGLVHVRDLIPGKAKDVIASLTAGLSFETPPVRAGPMGELVHLGLRSDGESVPLPLLRLRDHSLQSFGSARQLPGTMHLGPYPWTSLTATAVYEDGTSQIHQYRRPSSTSTEQD